jgi:hypothetical protein
MSTRELVDAMVSGKTVDMEQAFNSCVAERVAAGLDQMRANVAQNMFKSEESEEHSEEE